MAAAQDKPTDPPLVEAAPSANDNATLASAAPPVPRLPQWNPDATIKFNEVVRSVPPSRRPSFVSRPALPPDPGALLLDSLALDFESANRYVNPLSNNPDGSEIGRGGIGRVCLLVDQHLGREVALKELLAEGTEQPSMDGTLRLLAEARITGQLEHPNIVPVYDIGRRQDGRLYYTMRVIRGSTLSDALSAASSLTARLELLPHVARACNALAYAHSRGVIHRDIKPDNIMIGEFGETVVLDWGIAKLRGATSSGSRAMPRGVTQLSATSVGELVGTPLYMSPEQVSGELDLDETTDVWSLGVLLYAVLSGRMPFHGEDFEAVRTRILRGRPKPLRSLEPSLPPELIAVAERALARDKRLRYPSAKHLAADLDAYMSGARVLAHQYSAFDLVRRFARRHRAASWVALTAAVTLVSVAGLLQRRILLERDRAVAAERVALEKEHLARSSLAVVYADRAQSSLVRGDLTGALVHATRSVAESETPRARGLVVALTGRELWLPDVNVDIPAVPAPLRAARSLVWQGTTTARVHDEALGRQFELPLDEPLSSGAITSDGQLVVLGGRTGAITLWWPDSGHTKVLTGHRGSVVALALTDDGSTLASAGLDRNVHLWNTNTGAQLSSAPTDLGQATALHFDSEATRLFVTTQEHELIELEPHDWTQIRRVSMGLELAERISFASAGRVVVETDKGSRAWSNTRPALSSLFTHPSNVLALEYLSKTRVAAGGLARDGICLLDVMRSACTTRLPIQSEQVRVLAYAAETTRLAVGMSSGEIMIWNTETALPERVLAHHKSAVRGLQFEPDGVGLVSASTDGGVAQWNAASGQLAWHASTTHGIQDLSLDAATTSVWLATRGGTIERRDHSGQPTGSVKLSDEWVTAAAASSLRKTLFAATGEGLVHAVDPMTLAMRQSQPGHVGRVLRAALSPDEQLLATAGEDGLVLLWRTAPFDKIAELVHHKGAVRALRFAPDGTHLASAGDDRTVRLWDLSRLGTAPRALLDEVTRETTLAASTAPAQ